ncbi:Cell cycle serine/threonine-protein kinase cdc5/MSD2 [Verticillium nonalfalfae]|uniref:Cell cycle serine/threonine-protein kinase cdc5/MSD2 n=1 Tax=Verticillium nonalfalfae TaxID=1051616 RepID=A0A3M9YL36_9PEZI|nr:Cell cycle serine/threonine-protein kinase cdc5/MSD2 [Verticillium nonalfalfae]RNJ61313.1 Cell cycle serine/threonine-protein kinase cdc5/MSD2 [Verticillium nonalfalfae]
MMAHRLMAKGGPEMEALSPRDANAGRQMMMTTDLKANPVPNPVAKLKAAQGKDHPPPPPDTVVEPPSSDRPDGAVYQVGKLLGKGGFAICHQGYLMPEKKKYALKIVKSQMPSKMQTKFQTELQIHSKMKHRNIVQFLRAFSFNDCTFLVLELCPYGSLMEMVKKRKGLTEPEVRFYSIQIAGAIKYMHSKGIIHRDLKMGNIFLDRNMNTKVGDFGLAALLVTGKDMHTIRRTTLCGTPNYIAPEILEKGKKGHDHMVDIWSLEYRFAMLTSKPPFQSTSTDEIYRRARERDYEWPTMETAGKLISSEAKDIVATMLEDADRRPEPDSIVQHPFFSCGYLPVEAEMTSKLLTLPPDAPHFYGSRMSTVLQASTMRHLKDMCRECDVGPYARQQAIHTQTWKEMAAEEKSGLTPMIPLAAHIVYRPFDEWLKEQKSYKAGLLSHSMARAEGKADAQLPLSQTVPTGLLRAPPQSFAAQQRAQGRPTTTTAAIRTKAQPETHSDAAPSLRPRTVRQYTASDTETETAPPIRQPQQPPQKPTTSLRRALPKTQSASAIPTQSSSTRSSSPTSNQSDASKENNYSTLFSASEQPTPVLGTQPDAILERLQRLQTELERALNARTMAIISAKEKAPPRPKVVTRWVDYTNKFGLGYILDDGGIGCILRDIPTTENGKTSMLPPACMLIRNAEEHSKRDQDLSYTDRHQPVPPREDVHFYENNGEAGLKWYGVPARQFRVPVDERGVAGKMPPGRDVYEHRKRERVILWKKFANYMIAYGRDEFGPGHDNTVDLFGSQDPSSTQPTDLVIFYQRLGDVGCWVFCDGHLQFNFPDHTKLVINAAGTWCHFWHLPQDAAESLAKTGTLDPKSLDERSTLSYPLQTLLNFQTKPSARTTTTTRRRPEIPADLQGIPAANDFRRKIHFIKDVVKEWVSHGGLGNSSMDRENRLMWAGHRETVNVKIPTKMTWVTIGARWGDDRLSAYVDPRNPTVLGEEIDEPKRFARSHSS